MMILVGHDNFVKSDLIAAILKPGSSPVKRVRQSAEERGLLINATAGHKTRSVVVLTTGQVVLTALQSSALKKRLDTIRYRQKKGEVNHE